MAGTDSCCAKKSGCLLSTLRIVLGILFLCHGGQKLLGYPPSSMGQPPLTSMAGIGGVIELIGGAFLFIGLFTRCVAFVLSGEMAVAYFTAHAFQWKPEFHPNNFWPINNHGELAVAYCFVFLYMSAAGGGSFSIDNCRQRRRDREKQGGPPPEQK